jgi:hypothetical protein
MRRLLRIGMVAVVLALGAGCAIIDKWSKEGRQERRQAFVDRNPYLSPEIRQAICAGELVIGMTKEQAMAAWDLSTYPTGGQRKIGDINVTTTASGRDEQWCLGSQYSGYYAFLYFTNGVLTCIQN